MLEGFSKQEIRTITYLACEQSNTPKYKIIMQEFCDTFSKILFKLKKRGSNKIILKTASQISLDKSLINNLSKEDACSISYTAGYEQSTNESASIDAIKKHRIVKNDPYLGMIEEKKEDK